MVAPVITVLVPLADRLVIKPDESDDQTPGGILLPEAAKERPQQGTVIAAGSGRYADNGTLVPMTVKQGDKVLYAKYSGTEIKWNGAKHLIFRESDILAVVN